jgi:hypothetical protein
LNYGDLGRRQGWSAERERQALNFFHRPHGATGYVASSRCPRDGRLLGAISRLPDGIWIWMAGSRLGPEASQRELRSQYLGTFDETQWTSEIYEQASEYADEELRQWDGHVGWDPTLRKILIRGLDDPIEVADQQSPQGRPGLALVHAVTCGCRTHYLLAVYALVYAGLRVCIGMAHPGTYVRPMPWPEFGDSRPQGESVYSFKDGKMVIDVHERR